MLRWFTLLTVLIAWSPAAQADLTLQLQIDGEHEFFEKCEYRFRYDDHGAQLRQLEFYYDVFIRDDVHLECTAYFTDHLRMNCRGIKGFTTDDHTCADIRKIQVLGGVCIGRSGDEVDCGDVKLQGPKVFTFD